MKNDEGRLQDTICEMLVKFGYLVIRFNSGMFRVGSRFVRAYIIKNSGLSKGLPDVAFLKNGKIKFIEVKVGKNKMTDSQNTFKDLASRYGIEVLTFYTWVECYDYLTKFRNEL